MAQQCSDIDKCLSHISHYGPTHLSREINRDTTSLNYIWDVIRDWAQIEATGKSHLTYYEVRRSYDPETMSHQDFFHKLLHAKEDCLLTDGGMSTLRSPCAPRQRVNSMQLVRCCTRLVGCNRKSDPNPPCLPYLQQRPGYRNSV